VYCVEGADNSGRVLNLVMPERPEFSVAYRQALLGGLNTISFSANALEIDPGRRSVTTVKKNVTAIPYFSWNNRGAGEMQVWLPTSISQVRIDP